MLDSLVSAFVGETEKDKQIAELEAMDDHELADIGISRDQIVAFAENQLGKFPP